MSMLKEKPWILVAIFLAVFFISTYKLTESPRTWYDDGLFMQVARNVVHFNTFGVQSAPGEIDRSIASYVTTGPSVTYPIAIIYKFFGVGLLQARLLMVVFLLMLVAASFWLIYEVFGYKEAVISTLLLVSFAPLYGNGKIVLGEIPGLLFLVLFLLALNKLEDSGYKNHFWSVWAGLGMGLAIVAKPIFILLLPAVVIWVLWKRKTIRLDAGSALRFFIFFLAPVFLFYLTYFGKENSVFGVLSFYGNNYSAGLKDILVSVINNIRKLFNESTPIYFSATMIVWIWFYWFRSRRNIIIKSAESVAILFSILIGLAYLKTPGWYRYFFPGHILALMFFPVAFASFAKFVSQRLLKDKLPHFLPFAALGLIIIFQFYQVGFSSWVAGDYGSTRTKELRDYLGSLDKNKSIFVYQAAEAVTFLPHDNYYQYFHITGDRFLGDRQPLLAGIPDEVIIASKSVTVGREYLAKYKPKTRLYRDLYLIFEKK